VPTYRNHPDASAGPPPRPAATVLLLREQHRRLEVLMTRRAAQLAFMGDLWVFPGGRLEETDCCAGMAERVLPEVRAKRVTVLTAASGEPLDAATSLGLHVAGCRETFEESGVLLARRRDGSSCDGARIEGLKARRQDLAATSGAFLDMLRAEDLYVDVGPLVYWSHWITPAREGKRYDTRFFAIEVPAGQEASVDRTETTEHAWVTADDAFEQRERGTMKMAPPTLSQLQDLRETFERYGNLAAMLAGERGRSVPPILPKIVIADGEIQVVLPWDPDYAGLAGEQCAVAAQYPAHLARQPSRRTLPGRLKPSE
jgi:8-oxo-dGTP pyrophosphatase MutT (NUDIX family)